MVFMGSANISGCMTYSVVSNRRRLMVFRIGTVTLQFCEMDCVDWMRDYNLFCQPAWQPSSLFIFIGLSHSVMELV